MLHLKSGLELLHAHPKVIFAVENNGSIGKIFFKTALASIHRERERERERFGAYFIRLQSAHTFTAEMEYYMQNMQ